LALGVGEREQLVSAKSAAALASRPKLVRMNDPRSCLVLESCVSGSFALSQIEDDDEDEHKHELPE